MPSYQNKMVHSFNF